MTSNPILSIVAPCFNEEGSVEALSNRVNSSMTKAGITFELILVNDGSTDGTEAEIAKLAGTRPWLKIVNLEKNSGIPSAWLAGINKAQGKLVCFIDADLQNLPEDIPRLYEALISSQTDFVQAFRSEIDRKDTFRFVLSKALNGILNLTFGDSAKDNKSGFLIGPKFALLDALELNRGYFHFQSLIRVAARARGYTFTEVETLFGERFAGKSFLSGIKTYKTILQSLIDIARAIFLIGRGKGDPRHGMLSTPMIAKKKLSNPYSGWRRVLFETYFLTMPLHKWLISKNARTIYLQLKALEYSSKEELEIYQLDRLNRLLHHAATRVPYYRRKQLADSLPTTLSDVSELSQWPLLSKSDVRENLYFDLFSEQHMKRQMHKISTSGSTGQPFTTYADKYQLEVRFATTLRALEWTGWRFGDRQARLWHQTIGMSYSQIIKEKIDSLFMRRIFIPAFDISSQNINNFVARIRKHKPVLIDGYAESLNFLATYVAEGNKPGFSPQAMMSSAQALPDNVRARIEDAFKTRVFDKYGSREFSGIAYQCEKSDDHHVMAESYVVELVTEGRPSRIGEIGEILITDLNNYSVPLIRYRVGDLAEAVDNSVPCECGRNQPRIGKIQGRTQAIVICAGGKWMPGTFFAHFFKDYEPLVRLFQIHQTQVGSFTLKIVKNDSWNEQKFRAMMATFLTHVGHDTNVDVQFVDQIPLLRTGKRSAVVSEVDYDFQNMKDKL